MEIIENLKQIYKTDYFTLHTAKWLLEQNIYFKNLSKAIYDFETKMIEEIEKGVEQCQHCKIQMEMWDFSTSTGGAVPDVVCFVIGMIYQMALKIRNMNLINILRVA